MKIALIVAGVGDTSTCVNCLRDAALIGQLRKLGHEVLVVPLYLPFRPDGKKPAGQVPIFFGGVNVYLQQKSAFFRKTPRWFDRIFDNRKLLDWASGKAHMVDAHFLGQTTVSMLKGQDGHQVKELGRLSRWLDKKENKPDVICLSNALLAGLAGTLQLTVGAPIACLLHGEEKFLDELKQPYSQQAWRVLGDCVGGIDAFIAADQCYADVMKKRLEIACDKMHVVCVDNFDAKEGAKPNIDEIARGIASMFTSILKNFTEGDHA